MKNTICILALSSFLAQVAPAQQSGAGQDSEPALTGPQGGAVGGIQNTKTVTRPQALSDVTIEQHLNAQLPLDAPFRDEYGQTVPLGKYFGKRPVVLALVYYECPMLCTQILNGMTRAAKLMTLTPGKDYDILAISFDARETSKQAMAKKETYMKDYGHPETANAWHFLTGDQKSIDRVSQAVGFRYKWDAQTAVFAHASAIYLLTPEGKLSKYFYGIDYSPKDMRFGLIQASDNKIGTKVDQVLLFCYHFDPNTAKYTFLAVDLLRGAGAATLLALGGFLFIRLRRENSAKTKQAV